MFEQLGEPRLEAAVTTDICGKVDSHAMRLDAEAVDTIRKARVHRKAATVIFFESNGGQSGDGAATSPEVRLAVAEPDVDIGNVETALEALLDSCYYLRSERNKYKFGLTPNLNKMLADRRAGIKAEAIEEEIRTEVLKSFGKLPGVEMVPFPENSSQILDRAVLAFAVMPPGLSLADSGTLSTIERMIREHGNSGRTFKTGVLFAIAEDDSLMRTEARKLLAWEAIKDEEGSRLDDTQKKQLGESVLRSQRDLRESVWRSYKNIVLLDKNNALRKVDLGLLNSSQSPSITKLVVDRLKQDDELLTEVRPIYLVRNWPPAFTEWTTKAVRDAFFSSPQLRRLLDGETLKQTIARGVQDGIIAYSGRGDGASEGLQFGMALQAADVEISDDTFILRAEDAKKRAEPAVLHRVEIRPDNPILKPGATVVFRAEGQDQHGGAMALEVVEWRALGGVVDASGKFTAGRNEGAFTVEAVSSGVRAVTSVSISKDEARKASRPGADQIKGISWSGEVPLQKWMNFYSKVLARFATAGGIKLRVSFEVSPEDGMSAQKVEETNAALRELGVEGDVKKTE